MREHSIQSEGCGVVVVEDVPAKKFYRPMKHAAHRANAILIMLTFMVCVAWVMPCLADTDTKPFLHPLFSDHAVLQRDIALPVWGWTTPGGGVTVSLNGKTAKAKVESDGYWQATLGPFKAGGPHELTVQGSTKVTVADVWIGDVWICSGQSNMEMGIGACNVPDEIAKADFPRIRLLTVPKRIATSPERTLTCEWLPCSPESVAHGGWAGFSAAGYFFGRELHRELDIPIGLIHTSWGGTIAEAWTSAEALSPLEDFRDGLDYVRNLARALEHGDQNQFLEKWFETKDPGTAGQWFKPDTDDTAWKEVTMPHPWEQAGLPDYDGIAWFRREFDAPAAWNGKELLLSLGPIDDSDTTWFNGVKVGGLDLWNQPREYKVPGKLVRSGRNTIAIRVLDTGGGGGIVGNPAQMSVRVAGSSEGAIKLSGPWRMQATANLAKIGAAPPSSANNPNVCTVLYNGMISPVLPFAIKGAIWYQGESNAGRAYQYRTLLPTMITDWRNRFGVGDFPFYIVQLAAWRQPHAEPSDDAWAELREAQALTARDLANCGLAVAIDIGDANDIHPKNKLDVGRRLAFAALAQTYGKDIEGSGPWYKGMTAIDSGIRVSFDHLGGGLVVRGDSLKGFAIAGKDRKFVWADAVIDGDTVKVSSPQISAPVAVRYAWGVNPVCNLYNRAGLPAVPFRTDDWPGVTGGAR